MFSSYTFLSRSKWLRHCATSRQVKGLIHHGVIGIFHWYNPSGLTVALGLTHPLTEMSTRAVSWVYSRPVPRADKVTTFLRRLSWNLGASTFWNPQGLSRPVQGLLYLQFAVLCGVTQCISVGRCHHLGRTRCLRFYVEKRPFTLRLDIQFTL